jgi:prefoldin subunit 5
MLVAFVSTTFAEQSVQEKITLLETQRAALQWEFRYCAERMKTLEFTATKIDQEIKALQTGEGGEKSGKEEGKE